MKNLRTAMQHTPSAEHAFNINRNILVLSTYVHSEFCKYNMYNYKTIDRITKNSKRGIKEYNNEFNKRSHLTPKERKEKEESFFDNLEKWNCKNNAGTYDLLKYS